MQTLINILQIFVAQALQ